MASAFRRKSRSSHPRLAVLTDLQELGDRVTLRSEVRILRRVFNPARAYWVRDDVPNGEHKLLVVANHSLEPVSLPQSPVVPLFEVIARILLAALMNALQSDSSARP